MNKAKDCLVDPYIEEKQTAKPFKNDLMAQFRLNPSYCQFWHLLYLAWNEQEDSLELQRLNNKTLMWWHENWISIWSPLGWDLKIEYKVPLKRASLIYKNMVHP